MARLIFAKDGDGRVMHVSSVAGGLACECTCLDCGERLIARKGDIREHHFGHTSGREHDWAWETHLHAYAKQLIVDAGGLTVPLHENVATHLGLPTEKAIYHLEAGDVPIRQEVPMGSVRPDLVLRLPGRDMSIGLEIMVTHACDRKKVESFKRQRLAALEIDLSRFPPERFDPKRLEAAVLTAIENKTWLWPVPPRPARAWTPLMDLPENSVGVAPELRTPLELHGPSLPLPAKAIYLFPVHAWKAVITVAVEPSEAEGLYVRVSDMVVGRMAASRAEQAAPRVAGRLADLIFSISQSAHCPLAGTWLVPRWHANAVANAICKASAKYGTDEEDVRRTREDDLHVDLRGDGASSGLQYASGHSALPPPDKRDNPYGRRRG
jgi:hypothetical protein